MEHITMRLHTPRTFISDPLFYIYQKGENTLIDLTDYSFVPNCLDSMVMYFSLSITDEGYIPIFSYTKLFLVDLRPNNKVVFSHTAQGT